jgi:hypothetical protein
MRSKDGGGTIKLGSMVVAFVRYVFMLLEHSKIWDRVSVVAGYCAALEPHDTHGQPYTLPLLVRLADSLADIRWTAGLSDEVHFCLH